MKTLYKHFNVVSPFLTKKKTKKNKQTNTNCTVVLFSPNFNQLNLLVVQHVKFCLAGSILGTIITIIFLLP